MTEPTGNRASRFRPALISVLLQVTASEHLPDRLTLSYLSHRQHHLVFSPKVTQINSFSFSLEDYELVQHAALTLL